MALTKQKKQEIISEAAQALDTSKIVVLAGYSGTSVKDMQQLRQEAKGNVTTVKVIKNRLFRKALADSSKHKDLDASIVEGQLIYAFSDRDEVAPAQSLAAFAKTQPQIKFVGAYTGDGQLLTADDVQQLADLPSKQLLLAQLTATVAAPLTGFTGILNANLRGVINVLNAKAEIG